MSEGTILAEIFSGAPDTKRRIEASWYSTEIKALLVAAYLTGMKAGLQTSAGLFDGVTYEK